MFRRSTALQSDLLLMGVCVCVCVFNAELALVQCVSTYLKTVLKVDLWMTLCAMSSANARACGVMMVAVAAAEMRRWSFVFARLSRRRRAVAIKYQIYAIADGRW